MTIYSLEQLPNYAKNLPSLPEVVSYLTRALQDDSTNLETLAHHINSDPAIVARLLAAANAASAGSSRRVHTAGQAFLLLGADRIAHIALATSLVHRYDMHAQGFKARLLWQHSLGVAVCARVLAGHAGIDPELAFTCGLLHDIGQLLMFAASPTHFVEALNRQQDEDVQLFVVERDIFGYDHCEAGKVLAAHWKLPSDIIDAIATHHEPDGYGSDIGCLVHVSECLSYALDLGELPNNRVPELSEQACARLGLSWPAFAPHFAEIEALFDDFRRALGI